MLSLMGASSRSQPHCSVLERDFGIRLSKLEAYFGLESEKELQAA